MLKHLDPISWYEVTTAPRVIHLPLRGETQVDVAVIGGGFTGISSALHLAERGYRVALLEAHQVGSGASGRNGGQICTGQRKDMMAIEKLVSVEDAERLWIVAEEAKSIVRARIAKHGIQCDLQPGIITAACNPTDFKFLVGYNEHLENRYHYQESRIINLDEMPRFLGTNLYHGGSLDIGGAHLHPLNYLLGLCQAATDAGAQIYEYSKAIRIKTQDRGSHIVTKYGSVSARFVIIACNGYLGRLEPRLIGRIMPINNYILATEPLGIDGARNLIHNNYAVSDTKFVVDYFRLSPDHRLLFGGGENYTNRFPSDIRSFVRRYMLRVFPQLEDTRIDYAWGGTLAITLNRLPLFGRLHGDIYYALGYSGQGVALASLAGRILADAIAGTAEDLDLFSRLPSRNFPGGTFLRWPGLALGMLYYSILDRL